MPTLAFALIVKNEARMLPGCLDSIAPAADDIVVADTDSDDGTREIASGLGARVIRISWTDDFAAARNAALAACATDWVFVIDADERLAPEDLPRLRSLLELPEAAWRVVTRNYSNATHYEGFTTCAPDDPWSQGHAGWFPSTKVRLFPRREGVCFEGAVHELVNPSLERLGIPLRDADFPVHHYPLQQQADRQASKQALYLRLGELKAQQQPENPKAFAELGEQYIELGRHVDAVRAYRTAVSLAPHDARMLAGLGAALLLAGEHRAAAQALDIALRLEPDRIEPCRNRVVLALQVHDWAGGLALAEGYLECFPQDSELHRYAGLALARLGQLEEARRHASSAVQLNPANAQAHALLDSLNASA